MEDALIRTLNDKGYTAVKYPVEDIVPLKVVVGDGTGFDLLGPVKNFLVPGTACLPEVSHDQDAPEIHAVSIEKMDSRFGISLLRGILNRLAAIGAKVTGHYEKAQKVSIDIRNIKRNMVEPSELDNELSHIKLRTDSLLKQYLNQGYKAFIITEILKSNCYGVTAFDENNGGIDVGADAIINEATIKGKLDISKGQDKEIFYKGDKFLTIAFKAWPLAILPRGMRIKPRMGRDEIKILTEDTIVLGEILDENYLLNTSKPVVLGDLLNAKPVVAGNVFELGYTGHLRNPIKPGTTATLKGP